MKTGNTFNWRGVQFVESELLAELHDMCYQCNGFKRQRAETIVEKLSNAELEQAYWTISNKGVACVVKNEVRLRQLKISVNLDCYLLSKFKLDGAAHQEYFEKYVCGI